MHRSQLAGFIIDCEGGDLDEAASFWGRALGYEPSPLTDPEDEKYRQLETGPGGLHIEVQRVDHPSRVQNFRRPRSRGKGKHEIYPEAVLIVKEVLRNVEISH